MENKKIANNLFNSADLVLILHKPYLIHELRKRTGMGLMSCKEALNACNQDLDKAEKYFDTSEFKRNKLITYR